MVFGWISTESSKFSKKKKLGFLEVTNCGQILPNGLCNEPIFCSWIAKNRRFFGISDNEWEIEKVIGLMRFLLKIKKD